MNERVIVYGVTFHGAADLLKYALSREPKEGVYVRQDSKGYPCFDSSDYAYEDRSYWNFVFARSAEEADERLKTVKSFSPKGDYCKLCDHGFPMAYWAGDTYHPIRVTPWCLDIKVRR